MRRAACLALERTRELQEAEVAVLLLAELAAMVWRRK